MALFRTLGESKSPNPIAQGIGADPAVAQHVAEVVEPSNVAEATAYAPGLGLGGSPNNGFEPSNVAEAAACAPGLGLGGSPNNAFS